MITVIWLIIHIVLFASAAYAILWICREFGLPRPILWICGALLLIVLLLFLVNQVGPSGGLSIPRR